MGTNQPDVPLPTLFRPISIGELALKNRLAVAPMSRVSTQNGGVPTAEMADYYTDYANGGFGLLITEGTYTDAAFSQGYDKQPGLVTTEQQTGWRTVVESVHTAGAAIVLQLMHAGALSQTLTQTVGPSAVQPKGRKMVEYGGEGPYPLPEAMTPAAIASAVDGFVRAAQRAQAAGFDGVEIHGANGYLIDQFITTYTNHRTDDYGGPVGNRIRLAGAIIRAIRSVVPPSFVVGIRLSQGKVNDFDYRWPGGAAEGEVMFKAIEAAGADYIHIASEGRDWLQTARFETGLTITEVARQATCLPVMANGGMHKPQQAEQVLADGHADLVSLGTGALANPDWPRRVLAGQPLRPFDHGMLSPNATLAATRHWKTTHPAS